MAKKFYWLKLKNDFFNQREIKKLRKLAGGDTLTIIYLKLQLLSITNEGIIEYEGTEKDIIEQLSLEIDEDVDNLRLLLVFLQSNNLIETNEGQDLLMVETTRLIGSETDSAERVRNYRNKQKVLHCNGDVTKSNIEKEKREKSKENKSKEIEHIVVENDGVSDIIRYLNNSIGSNYKTSTRKTRDSIKARLNEGFVYEDFVTVIEKKKKEWQGTDMERFLRPETLFGTKFEGYLNQQIIEKDYNIGDLEW